MPMDKTRYPADWPAISRAIRDRDEQQCKWCGVPNGERGARDRHGVWRREEYIEGMNSTEGYMLFDDYPKIITIVLTVAHIDHDTANNDESNLVALCQKCHLNHDRKQHQQNGAITRSRKRHAAVVATGQAVLFEDER